MTTIPAEPATIESLIALLRRAPGYREQIVHVEQIPSRPARYAEPATPLPAPLRAALAVRGVARLYTHQAAALDAARSGAHLGIVTATASGKTLCYQLPSLEALLADAAARALFLFPTKALAQDQLRSLDGLLGPMNDQRPMSNDQQPLNGIDERSSLVVRRSSQIVAATLDGDTPMVDRDRVRAFAQIVLSNPDMLHRSLLPDHRRWSEWLARLRYVVLAEAHTYRGLFGTPGALT